MAARQIDHQTFQELIAGERPLLVDYWAPWCGYCRRITGAYDRIADQYADALTVAKINIDEEGALAAREQIEVIPTLVLYQKGKALGSIVAPESKAAIDEFIRKTLEQ